jgi:alanine racemase
MVHNGTKIIDKQQLLINISEIRKNIGKDKKICAMVKADAYGHGIDGISKILINKVDFLGVSNINEALFVRELDNDVKILIVGKTYFFTECIKNNISFTIDSIEQFEKLIAFCKIEYNLNAEDIKDNYEVKKCINIHLKIDAGMNRLGIKNIDELKKIYHHAKANNINIEGISTHFSTADCDEIIFKKQIDMFNKFINEIPKGELPIVHIGGSAVLNSKNAEVLQSLNYDMVRVGISMYGYNSEKISIKIKPIMSIESHIIKISNIKRGEYVGYSKGFRADRDMKIGIVPLGYGDGISRNLSNKINVEVYTQTHKNGRVYERMHKCAAIGYICMDMFFIDLTKLENVKVGDKVIVVKNVKKWVKILNSFPYEVLTTFSLIR